MPILLSAVFLASPVPAVSPTASAGAAGTDNVLPILDVIIVLTLLIALYIGYQRGVIQPLTTYIFFLGALFLIYRQRVPYLGAVERYLHGNVVVAVFLALAIAVIAGYIGSILGRALHRMPVARGVDGFLGIFLNLLMAVAVIYFVLGGLIALDRAFAPLAANAKLTQAQVTVFTKQIQSSPLAAALIDPKDLKRLREQAKSGQQANLATAGQIENLKTFHEDFLRPQLKTSRLAPYVMRIGQRIPFLGHLGPKDLPR
ncbi:MAG: CvpA family protein [Candidatus Dormibacteraeota bacterium]|nr:CvpA family protein [Candidatus Dormibacteraeota bacterium]